MSWLIKGVYKQGYLKTQFVWSGEDVRNYLYPNRVRRCPAAIKDGGCVASPTEPIRLGRWRRQKSVRIEQPSSAFLPTPGLNITHQWKTVCPQRQRIRIKAIASSDYVKGWFQSDCQKLLEPEDFIYIFSFSNLGKLIIKDILWTLPNNNLNPLWQSSPSHPS